MAEGRTHTNTQASGEMRVDVGKKSGGIEDNAGTATHTHTHTPVVFCCLPLVVVALFVSSRSSFRTGVIHHYSIHEHGGRPNIKRKIKAEKLITEDGKEKSCTFTHLSAWACVCVCVCLCTRFTMEPIKKMLLKRERHTHARTQ